MTRRRIIQHITPMLVRNTIPTAGILMGIRSRCGCADCKEHRAWVTRAKASKLRLDDSLEFRMRTDYGNTIVSYPTTTTMFMLQGV